MAATAVVLSLAAMSPTAVVAAAEEEEKTAAAASALAVLATDDDSTPSACCATDLPLTILCHWWAGAGAEVEEASGSGEAGDCGAVRGASSGDGEKPMRGRCGGGGGVAGDGDGAGACSTGFAACDWCVTFGRGGHGCEPCALYRHRGQRGGGHGSLALCTYWRQRGHGSTCWKRHDGRWQLPARYPRHTTWSRPTVVRVSELVDTQMGGCGRAVFSWDDATWRYVVGTGTAMAVGCGCGGHDEASWAWHPVASAC